MNYKKIITLLLLSFSSVSFATETTNNWWLGTFARKKLTEHFTGHLETQIRNSFEDGQVGQILYRTGVLYKPNLESSQYFGFLYGIIQTGTPVERRYAFEHGIHYINDGVNTLGHRIRFEGRDLSGGSNDSFRFRYLLRYSKQFNKLSGIIWDEAFINVTDEEDRNQERLERNRLFLGLGFKAFNTRFEVGYLNQFVPRKTQDTMEHIATVYWFF